MNDVLVQHTNWNLLHSSASDRAAETKNALGQAQSYGRQKRYYAHVDFGIEQVIKGLFAGEEPYRHLKILEQEGQITLSRTKNKKNLPQRETRNKGIDRTNLTHSPQDWS